MMGMSLSTFTVIHVVLSLVAIAAGFVVICGLLADMPMRRWTAIFLALTVATSVTGFGFPFTHFGPAHSVGVISLVALLLAVIARYRYHLAGRWRTGYVVTATMALYLNVFVGIVQAFQKVAVLHALAPTQAESPFRITQIVVLMLFIATGACALTRFHPLPRPA